MGEALTKEERQEREKSQGGQKAAVGITLRFGKE
jgi:hypothetical protein